MATPPMEEEDSSATSASSFAGSPQMSRMMADTTGNLDLNSYFLALANPDMSSASSDSQSQASRATSPSDWLNSLSAMDATATAKWAVDADSLLTTGIDPNALILGSEQLTYDPALYPFSFEHGISNNVGMMTIPSHTPSQLQEQQQQQTQLHYMLQAISQAQASTPTQPSVAQVDSSSSTGSYTPSTSTAVTQQVAAPSMTAQLPASTGNEADDVARRVRELAGITYAVTPAQQAEALRSQQLLQQQQQQQQQASQAQTQAQAFSIIQQNPALLSQQQLYPNSYPLPSQYQTSSPGPSSSASSPSAGGTTPPILDGGKGRTKTSHTTIERRYRTNLNERIIALRRAVPALRILERDKFPDERADERGYVDGVKAARKASKGSILGKAAEYIGVLKRRELRLRREYDGLKALITGLVGGPELFELWEREWRQRHPAGDDEDLAADDGDDEDGSEDEEEAKPRKKPKLATAPPPVAAPAPAPTQVFQATAAPSQPELKRKRGRPRKNPLPGAPATGVPLPFFPSAQVEQEIQQHQQDQLQPGGAKVLLGVFMLFSFLNPSTSPSLGRTSYRCCTCTTCQCECSVPRALHRLVLSCGRNCRGPP
ncbi:hypothetical protein DL93DRAFT_599622 [Clavulina sp. PMI_390]|nr:hypothetical protein DL93DRAFT_599622 [Clavulina sp. PMI_390]